MYNTTTELKNLLQEEVNDTSPDGATQSRYLSLLDRAHKTIIGGGGELNFDERHGIASAPYIFPWALEKYPLIFTIETNRTGVASVTNNSTSVTVDINSGTKSLVNWHIKFGESETYRITAHSGTTVTLDAAFLGETNATADFNTFKLIYELGTDILLTVDYVRLQSKALNDKVSLVDPTALLDAFPIRYVSRNTPTIAGVMDQTDGSITIQFNSYPTEDIRAELYYIAIPADLTLVGSNPIIPASYDRTILVHYAAYLHLRRRDDSRAESHLSTARNLFRALMSRAYQLNGANDENFAVVTPLVAEKNDDIILIDTGL